MAKVISQFFRDLGYPLKNIRWSWGARRENVIVLRTWEDEYSGKVSFPRFFAFQRPGVMQPYPLSAEPQASLA